MRNHVKVLDFFSFFFLAILLVLSIYFNVERTYSDASYYLFRIINHHSFIIEHGRPISYLTELIPYFLTILKAPVSQIVLSYSISEWIYFFSAFLILRYYFKEPYLAFGLLLSQIIGIRLNYFNPVSELILSSPLVFILYAIIKEKISFNTFEIILIAFLSSLILLDHPLNAIPVVSIFLIHYLYNLHKPNQVQVTIFIFVISILIIIYLRKDSFDASTIDEKASGSEAIQNLLNFNFKAFIKEFLKFRTGLLIMLLSTCFLALKEKKIKLAIYILAIFGGIYLLLILKIKGLMTDNPEQLERYSYPMVMSLSLAFFTLIEAEKSTKYIFLIGFIGLYHCCLLFDTGIFFKFRTKKLDYALSNCKQFPEERFFYRAENYHAIKPAGWDFFLANESMLVSAIRTPGRIEQVTIKEALSPEIFNKLNDRNFLYANWWIQEPSVINHYYFPFQNNKIRIVNSDSVQSNYESTFFKNIQVDFKAESEIKIEKEYICSLRIKNNNKIPLTSGNGLEKVRLSYYWIKEGGNENVGVIGIQTPLMNDVYTNSVQDIQIKTPSLPGDYQLQIVLVYNDTIIHPLVNKTKIKIH